MPPHAKLLLFLLALAPTLTAQTIRVLEKLPTPPGSSDLVGISILNDSTGMIFTPFRLWQTTDGGHHWSEIVVPPPSELPGAPSMIANARFLSPQIASIGGSSTLWTRDSGKSWSLMATSQPDMAVEDVFCLPDIAACWAAGSLPRAGKESPSQPAALASSDLGATWHAQPIPSGWRTRHFDSVYFFDKNHGVLVGSPDVYFTQDAGTTWTMSSFKAACVDAQIASGLHDVRSGAFFGSATGWLSLQNGAVLQTADAGATYCQIGKSLTGLSQMYFLSDSAGWGRNDAGVLYQTLDSGATWAPARTPFRLRVFSVITNGIAWALAYDGAVYKIELTR
jgi:photosystem II stability/assembly factor-like uncharacterized protein